MNASDGTKGSTIMMPRSTTPTLPLSAAAALAAQRSGDAAALVALPTADVAQQCKREMAGYRRGEHMPGAYAFELFRRAVEGRDEVAWAAVVEQFAPLVRQWMRYGPDHAEAAAGTVATFERFWQAVPAAKFSRFPSLAAVLRYLKLCAQSVLLDQARSARLHPHTELLDATAHNLSAADDPTEQATRALDARVFWHAVQRCLEDEQERTVVYLSYVRDLTPREICASYSAKFPTVAEVYRIKRHALNRLRRVPDLRTLW